MSYWWDRTNLESLPIESIKMIKVLDAFRPDEEMQRNDIV